MRSFYLEILFIFCLTLQAHGEPLSLQMDGGSAALLINADTGVILFEKDAYVPHYPASTTKVATALWTLKSGKGDLEALVVASQDALSTINQEAKERSHYTMPGYLLEPDGTHIGIKKGEELKLKDLLKGMLIASGNDAANVIAQHIGGTIPSFMDQVNIYLKSIGCQQTNFCNPHGLHHPQHVTTAYDLALMTKEALKDPFFCEIVAQTRFNRPTTNKQKTTTLLQTNRLLRPGKFYYSKAIGVKTGYHSKAKKTFIGAARSNGRTLIAVLLGYQDRNQIFQDSIRLFEAAFNQPKVHCILVKEGSQKFTQNFLHADGPLLTYLPTPLSLEYYPAEDPKAKCLLYWETLNLPILKNQKVGELRLIGFNEEVLKIAPLLAANEVRMKWPHTWMANLPEGWQESTMQILFGLFCLFTVFLSIRWIVGKFKSG